MTAESRQGLLVDTHMWVWLMAGEPGRLGSRPLAAVERAAAAGRVHVAAISLWEVAMLGSRGRI